MGWELDWKDKTEFRDWTEVVEPTGTGGIYRLRRQWTPTRGSSWLEDQVDRLAREHGIYFWFRSGSSRFVKGYALLDGKVQSDGIGTCIVGHQAIRFLLHRLGAAPPPLLPGEATIPDVADLERELEIQKAASPDKSTLHALALYWPGTGQA